jgi:hypothetical protein
MKYEQNYEAIYLITVEDLQSEAIRLINRKLTEDELDLAIKGVDCGLSSVILITMRAAIDEAIEFYKQRQTPSEC